LVTTTYKNTNFKITGGIHMTKLQFISELLGTTNLLLEAGVNCCTAHQARICLDSTFDKFEEIGDVGTSKPNTRGDLELFNKLIDSITEAGYDLWFEGKKQEIQSQNDHLSESEFIRELHKLTGVPYDLQEYIDLQIDELHYRGWK